MKHKSIQAIYSSKQIAQKRYAIYKKSHNKISVNC